MQKEGFTNKQTSTGGDVHTQETPTEGFDLDGKIMWIHAWSDQSSGVQVHSRQHPIGWEGVLHAIDDLCSDSALSVELSPSTAEQNGE